MGLKVMDTTIQQQLEKVLEQDIIATKKRVNLRQDIGRAKTFGLAQVEAKKVHQKAKVNTDFFRVS